MFIGGICISILLWAVWHQGRFAVRVTKYKIELTGLHQSFDGFLILHISDLHSKWFGPNQQRLKEIIQRQKYDLVALTGDLIDKFNCDSKPVEKMLSLFKPGIPVVFVPGNHEWRWEMGIKDTLEGYGVRILQNDNMQLERGGQSITIVGVDDPFSGRADLQQAMFPMTDDGVKILLGHDPVIFYEAITRHIDLVLAGHTHGGQVRLPLVGALVAPGQGLLPKLDYGYYRCNDTQMVINCGLGESDLPIRLNIRPEIGLIELNTQAVIGNSCGLAGYGHSDSGHLHLV